MRVSSTKPRIRPSDSSWISRTSLITCCCTSMRKPRIGLRTTGIPRIAAPIPPTVCQRPDGFPVVDQESVVDQGVGHLPNGRHVTPQPMHVTFLRGQSLMLSANNVRAAFGLLPSYFIMP